MTLRQPRRIFRGSSRPRRGGRPLAPALWAGLLGAAIGAGAILLTLPADLFGRVPTPDGAVRAEPGNVAVIDGDTLLLDTTTLRLSGVAVPPRGTVCHAADGAAFDCGASAARALADIVRGRPVLCQQDGRDRRGFPQARCQAAGTDLNLAVVASGWARAQSEHNRVSPLGTAERAARAAGRGLWAGAGAPEF